MFVAFYSNAQTNLKYSGFFDSYYTKGPLKYFIESGISLMYGDLKNNNISGGIGAGINYRILPPVYINSSIRYLNLTSKDHEKTRDLAHSGSAFQLNIIGNYHFNYDRIRTSTDRRRGAKKTNAYISTGLSFMLSHNTTPNKTGFIVNTVAEADQVKITQIFSKFSRVVQFPIGIGLPIRVTPRFTLTPEIMWYFSLSDKIDAIEYTKTNNNDSYAFINLKFMFNPKGKRRKPKLIKASNSGKGSSGGNSDDFDDDSFDNDFDNFSDDSSNDIEPEEKEEIIEEDSFEEEVVEDETDDFPIEEEEIEESENDGPKYDEDGFLIDEK